MLEIRDLHVRFLSRDREAVAGASLSIGEGEIVGLVGESGSGKTVTAMSVAGLLPRKQCAYSGEILLDGAELLHADRKDLRKIQGKDIGVVFQEPQSALDPLMKIGPQVEEVLRIHTRMGREERRRRALEAMAAVELPEAEAVYEKYPHQLSGGQRQRILLARALSVTPKLIVADEPVSMVDVSMRISLLSLMARMKDKYNVSFMYITHDLGTARYIAADGRIVVMYLGRMIETNAIKTAIDHPMHPYFHALISAVPEANPKLRSEYAMKLPLRSLDMPNLLNLPSGCKFNPRCPYYEERCTREEPLPRPLNGGLVACHRAEEVAKIREQAKEEEKAAT